MTEEIKKEDEELEMIMEYTGFMEYIQGAYFALSSVDDLDVAIMNKEDEKRVKRIRRKSIKIIDECLNQMYDELFETDEEDKTD
jgi:hypothetical protein